MTKLYVMFKNFIDLDLRDEEGQTAVEYAMVIALVAIAIVLALAAMPGDPFGAFWGKVKSVLDFSTT
jgi:Flp pilus assembly pilin Flp